MKVREVLAYKSYLKGFISEQPKKVQDKIIKMLKSIEVLERVPSNI